MYTTVVQVSTPGVSSSKSFLEVSVFLGVGGCLEVCNTTVALVSTPGLSSSKSSLDVK